MEYSKMINIVYFKCIIWHTGIRNIISLFPQSYLDYTACRQISWVLNIDTK